MRHLAFVVLLTLCMATSTLALDFTQVLHDVDGRVVCLDSNPAQMECPSDKELTLALAIRRALNASFVDEANLPGEEKFKRAELALALRGAKDMTLKAEDIVLIKRLTGKAYNPELVYIIWHLIDPALGGGK